MKTPLSIFSAFALFACALRGAEVTFEWDAPAPDDTAARFALQKKMPDGSWVEVSRTEGLQTQVTHGFAAGSHAVRIVAYSSSGVPSDPSDVLTFQVPNKPGTPRIKITLWQGADPEHGEVLATFDQEAAQRRFFWLEIAALD